MFAVRRQLEPVCAGTLELDLGRPVCQDQVTIELSTGHSDRSFTVAEGGGGILLVELFHN